MASAHAEEVFNCTKEEFYKIVSDYEKYSEFLPEVKSVKVLKDNGNKKEAEYSVSVMKTFKYKINITEKPNESIEFVFTGGDVFKTMKGGWKLKDQNGKCAVEYDVDATFGLLVPGAVAKTLVSVNLPLMMANFKKRVKQVYGK